MPAEGLLRLLSAFSHNGDSDLEGIIASFMPRFSLKQAIKRELVPTNTNECSFSFSDNFIDKLIWLFISDTIYEI